MQIYSEKLFENPVDIIEVFAPHKLKEGFEKLESLRQQGLHLIGYLRYNLKKSNSNPIMYFEAFENYKNFIPKASAKTIGIITKPLITKEEYFDAIKHIKEEILNGITYEVNYTYPSTVLTNANDIELYEYLLQKQTTPYNAFIKNQYETILSFSPELFFRVDGQKIYTKPMKGTAPKGEGQKEFLYNDIKNRAENIMIVDLLRNDLSQIAKTGTVNVDKLFEIEEHSTLYQMTSEISAKLENNIKLYDIFNAIFPCGSITGAPKVSTMRVIEETEHFSREVYCGAIGYIYGDTSEFSVPIRILQKKSNETNYTYHAGGAIVWDSSAEDEWQETLTKTKFLQTDFKLIETAIDCWATHVKRMKNSAQKLEFKWNENIEKLTIPKGKLLRVVLAKNGDFTTELKQIPEKQNGEYFIRIKGKVNSKNPFLYHKTTIRSSKPTDVFDEIRTNERGEITEGTYTNIGICKAGRYYTPPVFCGLLAGTFRAKLRWEEKILYPNDLITADKIFCFNSIRGLVEVKLCQ